MHASCHWGLELMPSLRRSWEPVSRSCGISARIPCMGTVRVCSINYVSCPMVRSRISATVLGLLLCAASAAAQVNVTLQLPFAQMPARVAEWRENESLIRIVVQNTGREQYEGLMLSVELSKDGRRIARSRNGHPAQPRFSLGPGETRLLSWREVISEEAVEYEGSIRQQVIATGELPEGQYQLCVQVLNAQLRLISPQACGSFGIVLADPPVLVSPIGGAQTSPTPLLQWSPSNPPAPGLQYQVTVKVRYRGQTPAQAMASNPVRLQATVPTTSYQVPVTEQLGGDAADPSYAGHVWQVQALLNGRPYGRNRGLSQIEWFVVPAMVVDTVKDRARDTLLPKRPGKPIPLPPITPKPRPLEWEIPYEELASGRLIEFAPKTSLREGEQITLRVTVSGIQEPDRLPLPELKLMNMTPGVVRLAGGDTQTIPIRPEDVSPGGTFTFTRTLTGIRPGGFAIGCQAKDKEGPPGQQKSPPQEHPRSPDKKQQRCQCATVETKRAMYWSTTSLQGMRRTYKDDRLNGLRLSYKAKFTHRLTCSEGTGECQADVAWQLPDVKAEATNTSWGPNEKLEAQVVAMQVLPEGPIKGACGKTSNQDRTIELSVWVKLPDKFLNVKPEQIKKPFMNLSITVMWKATIKCSNKTQEFTEEERIKELRLSYPEVIKLKGPK
jgi:hypothetical protein